MAAVFQPVAERPAPVRTEGLVPSLKRNLFGDWKSALTTLILVVLAVRYLPEVANWTLFKAVFQPNLDQCQAARGDGACWGVVAEKYRLIILGYYPFAEQWRPVAATLLLLGLLVTSCIRHFWKPWLVALWIVVIPLFFWVMGGGLGLTRVPTDQWGGLPLTIMLASFGIVLAFPLAVAIGYPDVVSIANTSLNQTGRAVECIAIIMLVYLTTSLSTAAFMGWYNKRSAIRER